LVSPSPMPCARSPMGLSPGQCCSSGSFIDDDYSLAIEHIPPVEVASLAKMHTHCLQVTGRHDSHESVKIFFFGMNRSLRPQFPAPVAVERKHIRNSCRFDPGNCAHAPQHFLEDRGSLGGITSIFVVHLDDARLARLKP